MNKILFFSLFLLVSTGCLAQVVGKVDKKTREFTIAPNQKVDFTIYGYQYANATTERLICFATSNDVVRANARCKLGSYYDTDGLHPGESIVYLGIAGKFAKMNFVSRSRPGGVFYIPRSCLVIR